MLAPKGTLAGLRPMTRHPLLVSLAAVVALAGCVSSPYQDPEAQAARLALINLQLGVGYMQEGKTQLALEKLRKAVKVDPNSADAHLALALLYDRMGEDDAADLHFRDAMRLAPENASIQTNYGNFLCRLNRTAEAEQQFRQAAENRSYESPELAYFNAGLCMIRQGAPDRAEDYLRQALAASPQFPPALFSLADLNQSQGRSQQARAFLQRYHDTSPPSAQSLALGVRIERSLGDAKAAATYSELLRTRFPDSPEARQVPAGRPK